MDDDFLPLEKSAWGGMLRVHAHLFQVIDQDLKRNFNLNHAEFEALLRLSWEPAGLSIQDLAARSILSTSGISRVADRLAAQGWIERRQDENDRRSARVTLTDAGTQHFQKALAAHVALVRAKFVGFFSKEELETMAGFWRRISS